MQTKLILAVVCAFILVSPSGAQQTILPNFQGAKALTAPPQIPHLPSEYPGQTKYKSIIERVSDNGREYSITFLTKDTADQVAMFYKDALRRESWIISPSAATLAISARRATATATVTAMQSSDRKMPTQVYVTYREWTPLR